MKKPFHWKLFFILLAAALFGSQAVIPYLLVLVPQTVTWQNIALGVLQTLIIYGLICGIGLLLANSIGLGLPIVEAALRKEPTGKALREMLPISILLGAAAGFLIIILDRFIFEPAILAQLGDSVRDLFATGSNAGPLKSFLASFYGGINEELLLRLFLMTLLAWLGRFISRTPEGKPTLAVLWVANVLAAIIFGIGHFPATATLAPLTPLVITRGLLLNGLAGVVFGYLYIKRGLESAMVAHFSADIVLHVIFGI